jgi:ankyrin repeat protein
MGSTAEEFKQDNKTMMVLPKVWNELDFSLFEAAMTGDVEAAAESLAAGADINYRNAAGVTPLIVACGGMGPIAQIEQLLSAGADVHAEDTAGWTALHYVCSTGVSQLLHPLLEAGAKVNIPTKDKGWTPLTRAAFRGNEDAVRILLTRGADTAHLTQVSIYKDPAFAISGVFPQQSIFPRC